MWWASSAAWCVAECRLSKKRMQICGEHVHVKCGAGRHHLLSAQPCSNGCKWRDAARRSGRRSFIGAAVGRCQALIATVAVPPGVSAHALACVAAGVCSGGNSSITPVVSKRVCSRYGRLHATEGSNELLRTPSERDLYTLVCSGAWDASGVCAA